MFKKIFLFLLLSIGLLYSCKSQFELLLSSSDVELKYKTAFELFNQKKYSKAASLFESVSLALKGTLQDDTVQYYIALSQYRFGDMVVAESGFESFIGVFPRSPFIQEARYLYIDCLYEQTLRFELDQTPTYKALSVITEYLTDFPNSKYAETCLKMVDDLEERLDRKSYESAKLYYTTEDYKAAHYAFKNVIKDDADNRYREDIMYYTALSAYEYAFNSISQKKKERYLIFSDDYYNFVGEFPESSYRKSLDRTFERVQRFLKDNDPKATKLSNKELREERKLMRKEQKSKEKEDKIKKTNKNGKKEN